MKVGLFSPYLDTMGGGERYFLTAAEFFLQRGYRVDIYSPAALDKNEVRKRFGIDITGAHFYRSGKKTLGYDWFFFLSDGSIPLSLAKHTIVHFQTPLIYRDQRTILNKIKLARVDHIVCNSRFTKKYIDQTYGVDSRVIYPPVDVAKFSPGRKENIILSVGRFSSPSHPKKQAILVKTFREMKLPDWKLVLLGGGDAPTLAEHKNITIIANCDFATLKNYYSRASIYWHAAGYGEDLEKFPDRAEHFGITTVEAMSAGAVPVVFGAGGQKEIIDNGVSGFFWQETRELKDRTLALVRDENLRQNISRAAQTRARDFSKEKFFTNLAVLV